MMNPYHLNNLLEFGFKNFSVPIDKIWKSKLCINNNGNPWIWTPLTASSTSYITTAWKLQKTTILR